MQSTESAKVENNGNNEKIMGNSEVKAPENPIEQPNNPNQTETKPQVQNNAQTQPQPFKNNDQINKPVEQTTIINGQSPNPTNIFSVQIAETQNSQKQQKQEVKAQEPQQKQQQCQTTVQIKRFTVELSQYLITFQLTNSQLIVKGQMQAGRKCLRSQFFYTDFTQQMKALFQSTDQMWSILESAQQCLFFQDFKLYFKIRLGQVEKRINIPLKDHDSTDQQYIDKLQRVVAKYKNLSKELGVDLQKHKNQCTCKKKTEQPKNEKKDINPKAKGKIKIDRNWLSRASSVWPEAPPNFKEKSDHQLQPSHDFQENDPLAQFEQLMEKLNTMRDQFNLLAQQIEQKVLSSAGVKILKLKLMGLEKKKKDYFYELDLEKIKFGDLKCRNDIYNEIDEFLNEIRLRYTQIETTVNLIRDDK